MQTVHKIAVVGAGAVGAFYGAWLQRSGHSVEFFTPGGARVLAKSKLHIKSHWGDFSLKVRAFASVSSMQPADLVILSIKALPGIVYTALLAPLVTKDTIILVLQNGINNDEYLQKLFPANPVIGGLAFTCINRLRPNHISHTDYGKIIVGYQSAQHKQAARFVHGILGDAGIETGIEDNLRRLRWRKLMWNVPFNGLSVIAGGVTTDRLVNDPEMEAMVRDLMQEVRKTAAAEGVRIPAGLVDEMMENTRSMSAYKTSMLIDYERGREMEVEAIFGETLRSAAKNRVKVPLLQHVYTLLSFYNRENMQKVNVRKT